MMEMTDKTDANNETVKLFGTDGMRGRANHFPITPENILKLALAAGALHRRGDYRHRVVIGKDTRLSGYMLEPALTAGFIAMGMEVLLLGPMPTPAVAMLTRSMRADLGVMISASHNPYYDNGIKLFGPDGYKISDQMETDIALLMAKGFTDSDLADAEQLGKARRLEDVQGRYIEYAKNNFPPHLRLDGLKIVIDCAHGAAYRIAPIVLTELGATIFPIGVSPDGTNINKKIGATHPQTLSQSVLKHKADLGIALDGDADRVIFIDERGQTVNGDNIMALIAASMIDSHKLRGPVIGTVMANFGFEKFLNGRGIRLVRTPVGDRHVLEAMRRERSNLGGEPSGHIIIGEEATTGDGLVAALQVLAERVASGKPLSQLAHQFETVPQLLTNVTLSSHHGKEILARPLVKEIIADVEKSLGHAGRIVIRASGTESLIRVMVEAETLEMVNHYSQKLTSFIEEQAKS